jgi:cytochrome c-type biogenesis protein CcmE
MKARVKFMLGGALVLGTAGYLMASSIESTGEYYLTPTELAAKLATTPDLRGKDVKVGARVIPGSIVRDKAGRDYAFRVTDGADTMSVAYHGTAPDTFTDGVDVVVEGQLLASGTFSAKTLLAKCASRYENAPPKYQGTPGYKAVVGAARG